ncbi:MAG: DUF3565 domain-containing protein [Sphingomonadales bacterium]|nr:DUF3565 domain-containing protein [Sphingomonadales bacterium]
MTRTRRSTGSPSSPAAISSRSAIARLFFVERPWVLTASGRAGRIGHPVECAECTRERKERTKATERIREPEPRGRCELR